MQNLGWVFLAILAGFCSSMQTAANSALSKKIGVSSTIMFTALISLLITWIYLFWEWKRNTFTFDSWRAPTLLEFSWGGLFGFGIVLFLTVSFPRLGALWTVTLMVLGQCLTALVIDHFGLFGQATVPVNPTRIFAVVIILSGIVLMNR